MKDIIAQWKQKMRGNRRDHWERVYTQKTPSEVSWYQDHPMVSLDLITLTGIDHSNKIIDVGAGASVLVDRLLERGYLHVSVLDISSNAIDYTKNRLGNRAAEVTWIVSDITEFEPACSYDLWHDRAVFHFLADTGDRQRYRDVLKKAIGTGGHLIISTFTLVGPPKCSGLNVKRYNVEDMQSELGGDFEFIKSVKESHITPLGVNQEFIYCYFKRR